MSYRSGRGDAMQRDQWRIGQLIREAVKNVFAPRSRLYGLVLLAVAIGVAVPLYSAWESTQLTDRLQRESLLGRNVLVVAAVDKAHRPASIDRRSCEAVASDDDVIAAGITEPEGPADFPQIGAGIPVLAVSTTLLPQLEQHGAIVGSALRSGGGAFELLMPQGIAEKAIVGSKEPEAIGTNSAVAVNLAPDVTSSSTCDVVLSATANALDASNRIVSELRSTGGPIIATQSFSEPEDPIKVFENRPEQFLPLLLALAVALSAGTLNRLRTGEWAAYRMSGTSPRSLFVVITLEQTALAGTMATVAAATTLAVGGYLIAPVAPVLFAGAGAALWIIGATLMSFDLPLRKPTSLAKDR